MHPENKVKTTFYRSLCLILAASLLITTVFAVTLAVHADGNPGYTVKIDSRVADPDTSAPVHRGFLDTARLHDGRIWTDKSVSVNTGEGADDFTVTLSALSQSFPISEGYVVPADTVFIIDVSGSMADENIGGRPRIAALVDALNEAIGIILDANRRNRVAVVAYGGLSGGHSRVEELLPLSRPELAAGATAFFTYRRSGNNHYVDVNTEGKNTPPVFVSGSTPTQRGIFYGANILTSATDLTIQAWDAAGKPMFIGDESNPIMVTRKPNIILMTDGEPTMAWEDYLFTTPPDDDNQTHGDGIYGEMGVSLLTVLTAAHRKKLVYDHYFTDNTAHKAGVLNYDKNESVGFYTISLNDVPPPALIAAAMFPFDPGDTVSPGNADNATPADNQGNEGGPYPPFAPTDSMGSLLKSFAHPGQTVSFYAKRRIAFGNYQWQNVTISNTQNLTLDDLAYADRFFPANDQRTLREAFLSITTDIQRQSFDAVTDAQPGHEEFDGYLVFSDVLGEYMEFRGITWLEFDGDRFYRDGFGPAVIANTGGAGTRFALILFNHLNYGNMPGDGFDPDRFIELSDTEAMIQSNISSGHVAANNSIKYYARANRDFAGSFFDSDGTEAEPPDDAAVVVELFPMWGTIGAPVMTDGRTDLMYIAFHLVTALNDNTVLEEIFESGVTDDPLMRRLSKGDQLIRWYIPGGLIPQRKVDPDTGAVTGNTLPIQVRFIVGLDEGRISAGISPAYRAKNRAGNDVLFYTNHNIENVTLVFYRPNKNNPFYHPGRPGSEERGVFKIVNPTSTASHVTLNRHTTDAFGSRLDLHWLGNNGRLAVSFDWPVEPPGESGYPPDPSDPPKASEPPQPQAPPEQPPEPGVLIKQPGPPTDTVVPQTGAEAKTAFFLVLMSIGIGVLAWRSTSERDKSSRL